MTFYSSKVAAMELLRVAPLKPREGQFCGGLAFSDEPLTDKQRNWLVILLDRHGLPPLADTAGGTIQ